MGKRLLHQRERSNSNASKSWSSNVGIYYWPKLLTSHNCLQVIELLLLRCCYYYIYGSWTRQSEWKMILEQADLSVCAIVLKQNSSTLIIVCAQRDSDCGYLNTPPIPGRQLDSNASKSWSSNVGQNLQPATSTSRNCLLIMRLLLLWCCYDYIIDVPAAVVLIPLILSMLESGVTLKSADAALRWPRSFHQNGSWRFENKELIPILDGKFTNIIVMRKR